MKLYFFKNFAKPQIEASSDPFIWMMYFSYCSLLDCQNNDNSFWDNLKIRIQNFEIQKRNTDKIKKCSQYLLREFKSSPNNIVDNSSTSKIKSIQIKSFKGFGDGNDKNDKGVLIEFNKNNTIFYGPNGSGKSSLCDALEYKLTGHIREALKRNRKVNEYTKRIGSLLSPSVKLIFENEELDCDKLTDEEKKYFAQGFIEKNRIHEFSLFGSKDTGIKKEEILSVLIGMDDLSDLANSFVQFKSFKDNLITYKRNKIQTELTALNNSNAKNIALFGEYSKNLDEEIKKAEILFEKKDVTIIDLENKINILKQEAELKNADTLSLTSPQITYHTESDFNTSLDLLKAHVTEFNNAKEKLIAAKEEVNFYKLYDAIRELKPLQLNICPSCDTPLNEVRTNPWVKAENEIGRLQKVIAIESELALTTDQLEQTSQRFRLLQRNISINVSQNTTLKSLVPTNISDNHLPSKNNTEEIIKFIEIYKREISSLSNYFLEINAINEKQSRKQELIADNQKKISELNDEQNKITIIKNNWENFQKKKDDVKVFLTNYTIDLAALNEKKVVEDKYNKFIDDLILVYQDFYSKFQNYKNKEFQTKFGNLESEIAGFYTQINRHDKEHESIEVFKINNTGTDYKIEYRNHYSHSFQDASIKFSEGHLRSLGLSILLANAKISGLPFIIFDDVVNAIDSDHRANIIEMMISDPYLRSIQQIISTHDRLYWERFSIENQKENYNSFVLKCTKEGIVHYNYKLAFKEKIIHALDNYDIRQALLYSRIWFETLAKKFCLDKQIELKGYLRSNDFHVSVEPTIGSIYKKLGENLPANKHLKILHKDTINYKGINQEHHSFDEYNFNFIHSRTSSEVVKIFEAVMGLDEDISFLKNHQSDLNELLKSFDKVQEIINNLTSKTPIRIQNEIFEKFHNYLNSLQNFCLRMQELEIEHSHIIIAEDKIKKRLLYSILNSLKRQYSL